MPANYVLLERIELNASAASVTFNNIPQSGYTDLKVVFSVRQSSGPNNDIYIGFNGSTSSFSSKSVEGAGAATNSGTVARYLGTVTNTTANTFANGEVYIPNYTSSNNKSFSSDNVGEANATAAYATLAAGLWSNTAAINSIQFTLGGSNSFVQYSTFSLYGLAAVGTTPVIAPKASGGNLIENDGTYWIHTFTSTGTFTPLQGLSCDYLVVAGGGGAGGSGISGGGGAGGLRSTVTATGGGGSLESALSVASGTAYTITVGAGGAAGATSTRGTNGSNSVFSTITSTGGGGGGRNPVSGATGGSGGGGYDNGTGGTGTANQGYAGGNGNTPSENSGGGGGGGAVGVAATSGGAGNGGNGVAVSITGTSVTYAGGGGGGAGYSPNTRGTGGTGGGGAGAVLTTTNSVAGTTNTGGGAGGGQGSDSTTKAGGSGIVIIRYPIA